MFTNSAIAALNDRLNSADWDEAFAAAVDVFAKGKPSHAENFIYAKSVATVDAHPTKSRREFCRELNARDIVVSSATLTNYAAAWEYASLAETPGTDPLPEHVTYAKRIADNVSAKNRELWLATKPEAREDVAAWLKWAYENYQSLKSGAAFATESEETPADDTESEETGQSLAVDVENGFAGQLAVLQTLAGRIQRGDFTVAEAMQLTQAAKGIIAATESLATAAMRETVAA